MWPLALLLLASPPRTRAPALSLVHEVAALPARPAPATPPNATLDLVPRERGVPVVPASASSCDIVFSHVPPRGILDKTQRGQHVGCPMLRARIGAWARPPSAWAFGHIHEAHGSAAVSLRAKSADPDYPQTLCLNAVSYTHLTLPTILLV